MQWQAACIANNCCTAAYYIDDVAKAVSAIQIQDAVTNQQRQLDIVGSL